MQLEILAVKMPPRKLTCCVQLKVPLKENVVKSIEKALDGLQRAKELINKGGENRNCVTFKNYARLSR